MSSNFDELLTDGMERFTTDMHAPRNLIDLARRHRRQRITLRTAAGGVTATAVAAVAFAALPSATHATLGNTGSQLPSRHDIEYVHTTRLHGEHAVLGSGQTWSIQNLDRSLSYSPAGQLDYEYGFRALPSKNGHDPEMIVTVVDFGEKTWQRYRAPTILNTSDPSCHPFQISLPTAASDLPAWIRGVHRLVHCGALVADGTEQVDGVKTIKLQSADPAGGSDGKPLFIWVSQADYVPVRLADGAGTKANREDVSWLPPTKANLAKLQVKIPAGFRKVSGDGSGTITCHSGSAHPHKQSCTHSG